jgi:hypothetical protein
MRKLIPGIIFILTIYSVNAQIPSSCTVPSTLQIYYDMDVKSLALQRIVDQNSTYKDSIEIPQDYQDTIWEALASVFNLTNIPERDSVFDNYCIHQHNSTIYHSIFVGVDTNYSWTHQWQALNTITGIADLDTLLAKYGFTISAFSTFGGNYATLTTARNINIKPVYDSIATFAGVIYAEAVPVIGDGDRITFTKSGSDRYFDFTVGYGDCFSGCTSGRVFQFKVYSNCSVDFLGVVSYQSPNDVLPSPVNCNITNDIESAKRNDDFVIYPNPTKGFVNISLDHLKNASVNVFNTMGESIFYDVITTQSPKQFRFMLHSPAGIYFVMINDGTRQWSGKVILE